MDIFIVVLKDKIYFSKKENSGWIFVNFKGEEYFDFSDKEDIKNFKNDISLNLNSKIDNFTLYLSYIDSSKAIAKIVLDDFYNEDYVAIVTLSLETVLKRYFKDEESNNLNFLDENWFFNKDKIIIVDKRSKNNITISELLPYFFYKTKYSKSNKEEVDKFIENNVEFKNKDIFKEFYTNKEIIGD